MCNLLQDIHLYTKVIQLYKEKEGKTIDNQEAVIWVGTKKE